MLFGREEQTARRPSSRGGDGGGGRSVFFLEELLDPWSCLCPLGGRSISARHDAHCEGHLRVGRPWFVSGIALVKTVGALTHHQLMNQPPGGLAFRSVFLLDFSLAIMMVLEMKAAPTNFTHVVVQRPDKVTEEGGLLLCIGSSHFPPLLLYLCHTQARPALRQIRRLRPGSVAIHPPHPHAILSIGGDDRVAF